MRKLIKAGVYGILSGIIVAWIIARLIMEYFY